MRYAKLLSRRGKGVGNTIDVEENNYKQEQCTKREEEEGENDEVEDGTCKYF